MAYKQLLSSPYTFTKVFMDINGGLNYQTAGYEFPRRGEAAFLLMKKSRTLEGGSGVDGRGGSAGELHEDDGPGRNNLPLELGSQLLLEEEAISGEESTKT